MNTQNLLARVISLTESNKHTLHLIHRLARLPTQPGSSNLLNPEAGDARLELSAEIHQTLKEQEELFELLQQEVEEVSDTGTGSGSGVGSSRRRNTNPDHQERTGLKAQVVRLGEDLKAARAQFRKAQLQAKRNAEAAKRKERELLFKDIQEGKTPSGQSGRRGQEKLTQDELLLNVSSDVTAALRRTHALMQAEVSRSQFARETLQQSTAALSTLSESYSNLDTLLSSSRSLVSSLIHSQKSDTWYLESAFWILISTIAWLVFRRFIYGPGWWLFYLPATLLWKLFLSLFRIISLGSLALFSNTAQSQPTTTLIIKPSATNGPPRHQTILSSPPSIAVGAGGAGAKDQPHHLHKFPPRPPSQGASNSLSEVIGQMAENTRRRQQQTGDMDQGVADQAPQQQQQQQHGTVLRERRSDEIPNPKKRMWVENMDGHEVQQREQQDEKQQQQQQQSEAGEKARRDEL